jgi:hypothetical protein
VIQANAALMPGLLIIANHKDSKGRVHKQINRDRQVLPELCNNILPDNKTSSATIRIAATAVPDNRETVSVQPGSKTAGERIHKTGSNRTGIARIADNRSKRKPNRRNQK